MKLAMSTSRRILILLAFVVYFIVSYKSVQYMVLKYLQPVPLILPGEEKIPFIPSLLLVYGSLYIVPGLLVFWVEKPGQLYKTVKAFFVMTLIHFAFFLIFPVKYTLRPQLPAQSGGMVMDLLALLYTADGPTNNFPSLHVSFAFLTYFLVQRYRPSAARAVLLLSIAVAISTVLIKQHYVLDVVAAIFLTILAKPFLVDKRYPAAVKN
jgi:membrane-associated phospholipid phosphatase